MCRLRQRCDPRCFAICTLALLSCRADGDASHGDPVRDGGTPDSAVRDASDTFTITGADRYTGHVAWVE